MIRKYAEIFCWKNVSSFCSAKATHIFSAKNIRKLYIESAKTVNEMTLDELVKLTTLWTTGPRLLYFYKILQLFQSSSVFLCLLKLFCTSTVASLYPTHQYHIFVLFMKFIFQPKRYLTLKVLIAIAADETLILYIIFQTKIRLDISCESSARHMKKPSIIFFEKR